MVQDTGLGGELYPGSNADGSKLCMYGMEEGASDISVRRIAGLGGKRPQLTLERSPLAGRLLETARTTAFLRHLCAGRDGMGEGGTPSTRQPSKGSSMS